MKEQISALDKRIAEARERLDGFSKQAEGYLGPERQLLNETLEEFACALQELHVMSDEIAESSLDLAKSREIAESARKKYLGLFEFAPDGYLMTDVEGVIEEANQAASAMLDVTARYLIGKPVLLYIHPDDLGQYHSLLLRIKAESCDKTYKQELRIKSRRGQLFIVLLHLRGALDANGKLVGLRWLIRDISAAKQAEATLIAQARQLAVNSELEQYVSVLAHDLQEPVRVLATYAMLLSEKLKDKLDEESSLYLQFAEQSAAKVLTQIEDLLSYSSLASRDEELELVDTGEVLAEVLSALSPKIKESGAKIIQSEMPTVKANREQLRRVFDNLIANAIKFSSGGKPHVRISSFKSGSEWVFCVRDKGIGIDMQYSEKVFRMFQRLHSQSEYQGNGIGLAICKRIIDYHHGRIWIESEPGAGTAIFFSLPISEVNVASVKLAD